MRGRSDSRGGTGDTVVVAGCEAVGLVSRRVRRRWRMVAVRKGVEGPLPCSTL